MNKLLLKTFLLLTLSIIVVNTYGQVSNLSIDEVYDKYRDSLKNDRLSMDPADYGS
jgi:hypothetical protein